MISTLYTAVEAANRLNCSLSMIYKIVDTGRLPAIRNGRSIRIHPDDLAAYMAAEQTRSRPSRSAGHYANAETRLRG